MRYFVGTELGVANLLQRHFCWTSNSLWFEEIPNARDPHKTLFMLGGKDDIIHSEVNTLANYPHFSFMTILACKTISDVSRHSQKPLV
jgi:hypothetical protein